MENKQKTKKKHVSRKLKSSWRKHVDISDVEKYLEEQRQDERIGNVKEKTDAELFTVQTKPGKKVLSTAEKRERLKKAIPRSYQALENTSKVQPASSNRRVSERKSFVAKEEKRKKLGIIPETWLTASKQRNAATQNAKTTKSFVVSFKKDVWAEDPVPEELKSEWYNKELVLHTLRSSGKPLVPVHQSMHEKTSNLMAIETPHPGVSYNPSFDDHEDLVDTVITNEKKIIRREAYLDRVITQKFSKMSREDKEKLVFKEMIEGFPINEAGEEIEEESDSESDDGEYKALNAPTRNKKKDRKKRRKQSEAVENEKTNKIIKTELKKLKDINKIGEFADDMSKAAAKLKKKRLNRQERNRQKKYQPRRVAYMQYEEPEIGFTETKDLTGNLRNMKPAGNLILERYKSLQKRNIIAPQKYRDGILRTKRALNRWTKYTLKSHKETPMQATKS